MQLTVRMPDEYKSKLDHWSGSQEFLSWDCFVRVMQNDNCKASGLGNSLRSHDPVAC